MSMRSTTSLERSSVSSRHVDSHNSFRVKSVYLLVNLQRELSFQAILTAVQCISHPPLVELAIRQRNC